MSAMVSPLIVLFVIGVLVMVPPLIVTLVDVCAAMSALVSPLTDAPEMEVPEIVPPVMATELAFWVAIEPKLEVSA